jgi:hypothetical protein
MKQLMVILLTFVTLAVFSGCGSSDSNKAINPEIIKGKTIYTFDEADERWIRVTFKEDGTLVYEWDGVREDSSTYRVENGAIVVDDNDKNPVIVLLSTDDGVWHVRGIDNDGKVWLDTWYFEKAFSAEMVVGKMVWGSYEDINGRPVKELDAFFETTIKVHNENGQFQREVPYVIEDGAMVVTDVTETFKLYWMFTDEKGRDYVWYSGQLDSGASVWEFTPSVNGPARNASGATEFTAEIVAGQAIYYFDEPENIWVGIVFSQNGQLIFERLQGHEYDGTYSVEEGKIVVNDMDTDPVIVLNEARATQWDVTGTGNDNTVWHETWYLERAFTADMIVGKRFSNSYVHEGIPVTEAYEFTDTTVKVYNSEGTLLREVPYAIEENAIVVSETNEIITLYLMFVDGEGRYNVWYLTDDRSGSSVWTQVD